MKLAVKGKIRNKLFFPDKKSKNVSMKLMVNDARQKKESRNKKWLNNRDMEAMAVVMVAAMAEAMVVVMAATEDMAEVKVATAAKADTEAKAVDHGVR